LGIRRKAAALGGANLSGQEAESRKSLWLEKEIEAAVFYLGEEEIRIVAYS